MLFWSVSRALIVTGSLIMFELLTLRINGDLFELLDFLATPIIKCSLARRVRFALIHRTLLYTFYYNNNYYDVTSVLAV